MNWQQQRLMVLGAGPLQVPLIQRAIQMGLWVVTVDYLPDNIGHRYSSHYVNASTTDVAAVLKAAYQCHIDAIVTACSDVAIPAVASVNESLDLHGIRPSTIGCLIPKDAFRQFQAEAGLPHPRWIAGGNLHQLLRQAERLPGPLVVKPVDRSGSRGVTRLAEDERDRLPTALDVAQRASLKGKVCVEQNISGEEFGGDALVAEGRIAAAFITRKIMQQTAVRGHVLPSGLDSRTANNIRNTLQIHVTACGFQSGPLNFDVMVHAQDEVFVLEVSPRLGGNGIPQLIHQTYGVDTVTYAIRTALGDARLPGVQWAERRHVTYVLGAPNEGVVESLPDLSMIRARIPELVVLECDVAVGQRVRPFRDSGDQIGRALLAITQDMDLHDVVTGLEQAVWEGMAIRSHGIELTSEPMSVYRDTAAATGAAGASPVQRERSR